MRASKMNSVIITLVILGGTWLQEAQALTSRQLKTALKKHENGSASSLAKEVGISEKTARFLLTKFQEQGLTSRMLEDAVAEADELSSAPNPEPSFGGAPPPPPPPPPPSFAQSEDPLAEAKRRNANRKTPSPRPSASKEDFDAELRKKVESRANKADSSSDRPESPPRRHSSSQERNINGEISQLEKRIAAKKRSIQESQRELDMLEADLARLKRDRDSSEA